MLTAFTDTNGTPYIYAHSASAPVSASTPVADQVEARSLALTASAMNLSPVTTLPVTYCALNAAPAHLASATRLGSAWK